MAQETIPTRVELDEATDLDVKKWARAEERSKRRHISILVRKLTTLRKTNPDDLRRLGLLEAIACPN